MECEREWFENVTSRCEELVRPCHPLPLIFHKKWKMDRFVVGRASGGNKGVAGERKSFEPTAGGPLASPGESIAKVNSIDK
jgi:hypothetical protein